MQAALDHHLVTSHTGAPDTEPKRTKERKIIHELPKYFGTMFNRVDIVKKREVMEAEDPQIFNPFDQCKIAAVPRTSANTVLDRLGTDLLPTKKQDLSNEAFSASAGSWSQAQTPTSSTPNTFPNIETVLEMDPFDQMPVLAKETTNTTVCTKSSHGPQSTPKTHPDQPSSRDAHSISPPPNPFASEIVENRVTNPFAPQPDGIGSYNYFASQLNKKLAIERMNMSKTNAGNTSNFTPFLSHGAFPDSPKQTSPKSFVPVAFGQMHENSMKSCSSMNDSVVSFVQGRNIDNVHSASPFKHGMHTQLEVPRSPYIVKVRDRARRIIPAEEPPRTMESRRNEVITFFGEKPSTRLTCFRCTKIFYSPESLRKHLSQIHALNYSRHDLDDLRKSPFCGYRRCIEIRGGIKENQKSLHEPPAVIDDMQTEYLRKAFTSSLSTHGNTSGNEDSCVAAHLTAVNRALFVGIAENIETGSIHGDKFVRFSLTIPFDCPPAGEHASDTITILCDCTPKRDAVSGFPHRDEQKSSTRQKGKHLKLRYTHLQERRAKQIAEIENHILHAVKSGARICVSGHLLLNPQSTQNGKRFFPVVAVTPSSGFISFI